MNPYTLLLLLVCGVSLETAALSLSMWMRFGPPGAYDSPRDAGIFCENMRAIAVRWGERLWRMLAAGPFFPACDSGVRVRRDVRLCRARPGRHTWFATPRHPTRGGGGSACSRLNGLRALRLPLGVSLPPQALRFLSAGSGRPAAF